METVVERFIRYAKVHTTSIPGVEKIPSSDIQFNLGNMLVKELKKLGLIDVKIDTNGYVMATLQSNIEGQVPVLGFIAHMDTSPDFSGENVKPRIVENYDGSEVVLNEEDNVVIKPSEFPELLNYKGQDIIFSDGNTLLGADDKAGIAEIVTAMEYLSNHPEIKHGDIKICFTPDEEVGKGADLFQVKEFGADFAYTIDGGEIGELEFENFNAATASIIIFGRNVHPGYAKNKMINSMSIACELAKEFPENEVPEYTTDYEGFYHLISLAGDVEKTELHYIIRDFDMDSFKRRKRKVNEFVEKIKSKYDGVRIDVSLVDQYYNMREKIEPVMHVVKIARQAMEIVKVKPLIKPIRGGTDGARLSFMGLPTPNLFAGGHNFHGRYEFIPIQSMGKAVEVIVKISELVTSL